MRGVLTHLSQNQQTVPVANNARSKLLLSVDLAGTFLFAVEGATAAVWGNLDFFGLMVLGFATASVGGVVRDILIGAIPPQALRDWRYPAVAFAGATAVFFLHHYVQQIPNQLMVTLDGACLALFAVAGAEKALAYQIHPFIASLLGTVTAVGGGTVRDVLLAKVPIILHSDVYATCALVGSVAMIASRKLGLSRVPSAVLGGVACFLLRVISVWQHWNLPKVVIS